MKKTRVISAIFLAVFLCLSVSAVYAQNDQYETHAEINSVNLNGQGDYLKIGSGELIEVEVLYEFWYPYPLPKDIVEIVVGFEDTPGICLIDGILDDITGLTGVFDFERTFGMNAPTEPGIYHLYRVRTKGYTCDGARELYRNYPDTRHIIGTIEVIGQEAYAEVYSVELNGEDNYIKVGPGEAFAVEVFFGYVAPASPRPEDKVEIVIAFDYRPIGCLIEEIGLAEHLGGHDYLRTFTVGAPSEPGIYKLTYGQSEGCTCQQAKLLFNLANTIGTIEVIKAENEKDEKWTLLHQSNRTLTSILGDRLYTIAFLQRQNDLRVQIETPGSSEVETGKVFISVDEDVFVKYNTGCVYDSLLGVEDSDFFELKPGASSSCETSKAFFDLVMGFVPYSGMFASSINLGTAIYNDTSDEFEVNENLDLERILDAQPYEYFTTNTFQNERDVITIPWALDMFNGRQAIRVDCPEMRFPSEGMHTVVFCVIVNVHNVNVRHTIGLPIKIGKQKIEI